MPAFDAQTSICIHCDGADASTGFFDSSQYGHSISALGTAKVSTAQSKFGGASANFNGSTGNRLQVPDSPLFDLGAVDFTIEFWVNFTSLAGVQDILNQFSSSINDQGYRVLFFSNTLYFTYTTDGTGSGVNITQAWAPSTGVWYHVAIVRSGNVLKFFVNGTQLGTDAAFNFTIFNSAQPLCIGCWGTGGSNPFNGYLDEIRISKGIARWTSNFTPPSAPYDFGRFWVGGAGTWDNISTAHWSNASGGSSGATPPGVGDAVIFDANSGLSLGNNGATVTVAATAVCSGCLISGIACRRLTFSIQGDITWDAGTFSFQGADAASAVLIASNVGGTPRMLTLNGTHGTHANIHFRDMAIVGTAGVLTGSRIGDLGGNSGITFTAPVTTTWQGTLGGNFSDPAKWDARVPLPQDTIRIASAFAASQTIYTDLWFFGGLDFTGTTGGSLTVSALYAVNICGDLILSSGVFNVTFGGQSTAVCGRKDQIGGKNEYVIDGAGKVIRATFSISALPVAGDYGATYKLLSKLTIDNPYNLQHLAGVFDMNDFDAQANSLVMTGSSLRRLIMRAGTFTCVNTGSAIAWSVSGSNHSIDPGTSTIVFTNAGAGTPTFAGGGFAYNTFRYTTTGSGGLIITGNNTFQNLDLQCTTARTITLPANSSQTVLNTFTRQGAAGQALSLVSSTPGTPTAIRFNPQTTEVNGGNTSPSADVYFIRSSSFSSAVSPLAGDLAEVA